MPRRDLLPYFKVLFAVIVWGGSFIATKVALQDVTPVTVVWLRFGIGVLILGYVTHWRKQLIFLGWRELPYFAVLGFLGIAFHQWLQSTGLVTAQASTTAWIVSTTPIFMAVLGWLVLREKLTLWQVFGIALASLGVLLVVSEGRLGSLVKGDFGAVGNLFIIISAPNWAIFSTFSRRGLQKYPAGLMLFYVMGFGWLFTSVLFFSESGISEIAYLTLNGWAGILFLGIICSGMAYIFWYDALQAIPASQVGAFLYLEPLVAVVVAAIILGEPILLASLLGGATILLGVWLVNRKTTQNLGDKE